MDYAEAVRSGNRLALARLLTLVENGDPEGRKAMDALFPYTGQAHLIGVTGSPGTGKSSLVNQLALAYRRPTAGAAARRVAIVAVDPSSPFSGGALLGDRVRMRDLSGDPGIFIRSMASRGTVGGLARATAAVVQVLDAAGYEIILVETVGAGQSEVDIARLAHTTLVVEAPGLGDDIQASKAGILEIADILVVNKGDRPGVESTERFLRNMLEIAHPEMQDEAGNETGSGNKKTGWIPPILRTVATRNSGIQQVLEAIENHKAYLQSSGEWQRRDRDRLLFELNAILRDQLYARWRQSLPEGAYNHAIDLLMERKQSIYSILEALLQYHA